MSDHGGMRGLRFSGTVCNLADLFIEIAGEQEQILFFQQVEAGNPQLAKDLKLLFLGVVSNVVFSFIY